MGAQDMGWTRADHGASSMSPSDEGSDGSYPPMVKRKTMMVSTTTSTQYHIMISAEAMFPAVIPTTRLGMAEPPYDVR